MLLESGSERGTSSKRVSVRDVVQPLNLQAEKPEGGRCLSA